MQIVDEDQLIRLLDSLHAEFQKTRPSYVSLHKPPHGYIAIGLGKRESVLSFVPESRAPPYLASKGSAERTDLAVFDWFGEPSEIPGAHLIPRSTAYEAVLEFARTGSLSKSVAWSEV
jgi:hypothetical protein